MPVHEKCLRHLSGSFSQHITDTQVIALAPVPCGLSVMPHNQMYLVVCHSAREPVETSIKTTSQPSSQNHSINPDHLAENESHKSSQSPTRTQQGQDLNNLLRPRNALIIPIDKRHLGLCGPEVLDVDMCSERDASHTRIQQNSRCLLE